MGLIVNEGLDLIARISLNKASAVGWQVRLFANNYTPVFGSTLTDFVESTNAGYAAISLTGSSWSGSTSSGLATYDYPSLDFTFTADVSPDTIYGYYVVAPSVGIVGWAERFPSPYPVPASGGTLTLNLTYLDQSVLV